MNIREITSIQTWNEFFNKVGSPSFHQSWEWGEFQKNYGYDILRLGLYDNENLLSIALVIKIRSKRGNFLFIPHGPVFNIVEKQLSQTVETENQSNIISQLKIYTEYLTQLAKQENFWFIRIAPILDATSSHQSLFNEVGYRQAPIYIHAETMWAVDLTIPEGGILNAMRKNTRYYIRRAEKEDVKVEKYNSLEAMEEFWKLYEVTSDRENFTPFPKKFIEGEFQAFHDTNNAIFLLSGLSEQSVNTEPSNFAQIGPSKNLAGALVLFTQNSGFYHQGASIHTKIPVTYALQWEAILEAKQRGCKYYNLYGIYKEGRTPKAWEGLSLFKRGFGGFEINYLPTQDYVISPLYYFSYAVDRYLSWRRGI